MGKKVLMVIDYQKDFVDGALGFESAKNLDAGIADLVKQYMSNGDIVIFTEDTHEENYLETQEGRKLPVKHCIKGSDGWQLYGLTGEAAREQYADGLLINIEKATFGSNHLMEVLGNLNTNMDGAENLIESITLVGVVTNMCVISNAVIAKAACPEAEIIIKKDLVDGFDKELHQKGLDVMASMQMTVE